jgi:CPA1 family monovalent cation:H+ antiporter
MDLFQASALLLTLAALFNYVNYRFLKIPASIGIMLMGLVTSLILLAVGQWVPAVFSLASEVLSSIDFNKALMNGMLGLLLFAGALHVDIGDLTAQKGVVAILATIGVSLSTFLVGFSMYALLAVLGLPIPLIHCLLFGALISPTDPIAVLSILKTLGAPKELETKIAGESLFNDGVGVVIFLAMLGIAGLGPAGGEVTAGSVAMLFVQEAFGGAAFGLLIGYFAYRLLRSIDDYQVEILISLALVTGGYALAQALHLSGPIAMVVAGLFIGNRGRALAMSDRTRLHLDLFWELIDEILNAVLFVLIGLTVLVIPFESSLILPAVLAIPLTLASRFIAVALPMSAMAMRRKFTPHAVKILTWGGLRGGISVALALWLSELLGDAHPRSRGIILAATYSVVVFSIVVQGLTIGPLLRRLGLIGGDGEDGADGASGADGADGASG